MSGKNTTTIIDLSKYLNRNERIRSLARHGKTMVMMYKNSGDAKYLDRARRDLEQCKEIINGFMHPMGVK